MLGHRIGSGSGPFESLRGIQRNQGRRSIGTMAPPLLRTLET